MTHDRSRRVCVCHTLSFTVHQHHTHTLALDRGGCKKMGQLTIKILLFFMPRARTSASPVPCHSQKRASRGMVWIVLKGRCECKVKERKEGTTRSIITPRHSFHTPPVICVVNAIVHMERGPYERWALTLSLTFLSLVTPVVLGATRDAPCECEWRVCPRRGITKKRVNEGKIIDNVVHSLSASWRVPGSRSIRPRTRRSPSTVE